MYCWQQPVPLIYPIYFCVFFIQRARKYLVCPIKSHIPGKCVLEDVSCIAFLGSQFIKQEENSKWYISPVKANNANQSIKASCILITSDWPLFLLLHTLCFSSFTHTCMSVGMSTFLSRLYLFLVPRVLIFGGYTHTQVIMCSYLNLFFFFWFSW